MRGMGQRTWANTRLFSLALVSLAIAIPAWGQVSGADYRAGQFADRDAGFDSSVGGVLMGDPNDCDPNPTVTITITTDAYGGETTWTLVEKGSGEVVAAGGPYLGFTTYVTEVCVFADQCYTFNIYDTYGDGIHAPGGYRLRYGDVLVASTLGIGWSGPQDVVADVGTFEVCDPVVGACCIVGECVETGFGTENECRLLGGFWIPNETCATAPCPPPPACPPGALMGQPPYDADASWVADRSEVSQGQRRLENFNGLSSPVTEVHWWGVFGTQDEHGWYECLDESKFRIGLWHDDGGQPGPLLISYEVTAQAMMLQLAYPPFTDGLILFTAVLPQPCPLTDGWISIEGVGHTDCWFLWMNSPDGDSISYLDTGVLQPKSRNLSLCLISEYEPVFGSCCDEPTGTCTDDIEIIECVGTGLRFTPNTACADLNPDCGDVAGACCFSDGVCQLVREPICAALNPADCNCDGTVDFDDIDYFVAALSGDEAGWASFYASHHGGALPSCPYGNNDVNRDGSVDFDDIDPFVVRIGAAPLSRVWLGPNTACDDCPCLIDCPSGGQAEDEPCLAQLNEGCAMEPPAFDVLACGDVICGTLGSDAGSGQVDTDWYAITVTEDTNLTLTIAGQPDPVSVGVAVRDVTGDPNCFFITDALDPIATATDCQPASITTCLPPGTHYVNVSTSFDPGQPCPMAYVLTLDCPPCVLPVGACCLMTGDCGPNLAEADCAVLGGVWLEGEVCETCPIPDPGDNCLLPLEINLATDLPYDEPNATTCGRFNWHSDTCLGDFDTGQEVLYRLTVPSEPVYVEITLDPQETAFTGMLLAESCPPGEDCLASFKRAGTAPYSLGCLRLIPGVYYLMIDSIDFADDPNDCIVGFDLSITDCTPAVGRCCIGPDGEECVDNLPWFDCLTVYGGDWMEGLDCSTPCPIAVGETCAEATPIAEVPYLATFNNDESTADGPHGQCDNLAGSGPMQNDVWFAWTADTDVWATVTITPTDYDAIVAVRDDCVALQEFACADDASVGGPEAVGFAATAGMTYYIQVGDAGQFEGGGMTQLELTTSFVTGACCFDEGVCIEMTPAACAQAGGEYWGDDTSCDPNPCPKYCDASGGCDEFINRVEVGTINWTSGCDGYGDFSAQSTMMERGEDYGITVTLTDGYAEDQCAVWVNWDQDAEFDAGEMVTLTSPNPEFFPFVGTITPPSGAPLGETRLRIRLTYDETPFPCGVAEYGEVEDYTVEVTP